MANISARAAGVARDPAHWHQLLSDLNTRIASTQLRVDANESERGLIALAALAGEAKTQRALDRLNADRHSLDLELANLTRARIEAERRLSEVETRARMEARRRERTAQQSDLKDRARLAR